CPINGRGGSSPPSDTFGDTTPVGGQLAGGPLPQLAGELLQLQRQQQLLIIGFKTPDSFQFVGTFGGQTRVV
ncbi:MAG: hypothetical protein QM662_16340, partial [Gordonia sp. (in: high G+C Gram-positive bacteria)]